MTTPPPDWIADLVIYELNPRGFTSPNGTGDGSGSGTFDSLRSKLPYLRDLGVTAIWLAGYCEATKHFYGIWSVYANVRPDRFDPTLGDAAAFQRLVDSAHRCGIRVLLDVISHGVVAESPLVAERPDWFRGGSWGMCDYDYSHPGFREWWVDVWTEYVLRYGVDGFRVDVSLGDKALWDQITATTACAGRPIVVFGEDEKYHFQQLSSHFEHGHELDLVNGAEHKPFAPPATRTYCTDIHRDAELATDRYSSVEVSCHDAGWKCPPGNYYVVRGSRFRLGYGALFTPHIPILYAGEEFDADQTSLPDLRRDLYGGDEPGGWLYGAQIHWDDLNSPARACMLVDSRRMLEIRRTHRSLLNADRCAARSMSVPCSAPDLPKPYARYAPGEKAIVVAGNDSGHDRAITLALPLDAMSLAGARRYLVTDLLTEADAIRREDELRSLHIAVPRDHVPGGGVRVLMIEPLVSAGAAGAAPRRHSG
jgi:Alpha amylase, catalytic domain